MASLRNFLLALGVYYLSTWAALPLSMAFPNAHVYTESILSAIVFGMEMEMGLAVAGACAGGVVTLIATGGNSERWAFLVAALYLIRRIKFPAQLSPWYRMVRYTAIAFPAALCLVAAYTVGHLRNRRTSHA